MRRAYFIKLCAAILLPGCESFDQGDPPKLPSSVNTQGVSAPFKPADVPKRGRVGYGFLATHYDRDGDGVFEEARRGETIYFDRNGDRIADFIEEDTPPFRPLKWDANFDGMLDHAITSDEGTAHQWANQRDIMESAPLIFRQDRIGRLEPCELREPKYRFWESRLGLESQNNNTSAE